MRIAIFIGSDLRNFGGGEKYVIELSNRLKNSEITIFSYKSRRNLRVSLGDIKNMTDANIKYYNAIEIKSLQERFIATCSGIRSLLELKKFDTIYCTAASLNIIFWLLIFSRIYKKKFILGIHYVYFLDNKPFRKTWIGKRIFPVQNLIRSTIIKRINFLHVLNNYDKKSVESIGYNKKIYHIPNFVYSQKVHLYNNNKFVALFVGRISVEHKGLDLLGNIIELINKKCDRISFEIVGSGNPEDEEIIKNFISKRKNVRWFGFLSENRLTKRYLDASLYVMPSRTEGFPLSLLEAQSYGLPAIAFDVKGINSIIKINTGRLVEPFDVDDFANSIIKYYKVWHNHKMAYLKCKNDISNYIHKRYGYANIESRIDKMMQPL